MSRSRQVSLPLNKAVFSVKVKCCNAHHTIALTDEGSLRLCNHQDDMDAVEGMLLLNPSFRCRCLEVREWWRVYLAGTEFESDGEESSLGVYPDPLPAWMRETLEFTNDYGVSSYREQTHRFAFYQLPKGLRPYAEEAMDLKRLRREVRWSGPDGELAKVAETSIGYPPYFIAVRHSLPWAGKWTRFSKSGGWGYDNNVKKERAEAYVEKYFARLLHNPDVDRNIISTVQLNDSHASMFLRYGVKLPFHKEALAEGIVPLAGPPLASLLDSPRFDADLGPYPFEGGVLTRYRLGNGSNYQTMENYKMVYFTAVRSDAGRWVFTTLDKARRHYNFPLHHRTILDF